MKYLLMLSLAAWPLHGHASTLKPGVARQMVCHIGLADYYSDPVDLILDSNGQGSYDGQIRLKKGRSLNADDPDVFIQALVIFDKLASIAVFQATNRHELARAHASSTPQAADSGPDLFGSQVFILDETSPLNGLAAGCELREKK